MPFLGAALGPVLGGLGGIAGSLFAGGGQSQSQSLGVNAAPLSANALDAQSDAYQSLQNYARNSWAGTDPNAQANLMQLLQQYSQSGGLPNQGQIGAANQYAQNIFAPQQEALNNTFNQAQINTNRQAASLGRPVNDPILQAKLAQYQGQQQNVLSGQKTALGSQVAMGLPQQQLGFQQQLANQASQNQLGVLQAGQGLLQNAQTYNLGLAGRNIQGKSGGGLGAGLLGGLAGLGGGFNLAQSLGAFGGGGGSGGGQAGLQAAYGFNPFGA